MYMAQKAKKKSKLRHAEYYDMQKTFDSLYADSKSGEVFGHLMDIISAPNNIKLAFRNIKGNDGSHTAGTDGRTIESLAVMSEDMSSERNRTNGIFRGRGRRRIPGAIAPDRLNGKDLPPHHPGVCGLRTRIPDRTALRAMMA